MGTCFPIQVVVWIAFSSSDETHIESKLKMSRLLNSVLSFETGILKPSKFSNSVSRSVYTVFG